MARRHISKGWVAALAVSALLLASLAGTLSSAETGGQARYAVVYAGENGTISVAFAVPGDDFSGMIVPDKGYCVPDTVTVTVGGSVLKQFSYESPSGILKIAAEKIKGEVRIKGDCPPKTMKITLIPYASSGSASFTAAYGTGNLAGYVSPSLESSSFKGYWSGPKGTGVQVIGCDGMLKPNAEGYSGGGKWICERACTLYAKWEQIGPGVTYHGNGGHFRGGSETMKGDCHLRFDKTPNYDCYRFLGWAEERDAKVPKFVQGQTAYLGEGTELYAVWEYDGTAPTDSREDVYVDVFLPIMVLLVIAAAVVAVAIRRYPESDA